PFVAPGVIRAAGCEPVTLEELLERSDVVSLHARATADNQGLLDRERLRRMRTGSWLINTARDTLVVEAALDDALRTGHLAGAAAPPCSIWQASRRASDSANGVMPASRASPAPRSSTRTTAGGWCASASATRWPRRA